MLRHLGTRAFARRPVSGRANAIASLSIVALYLAGYAWAAAQSPYGSYDAWAIWNQKARFLAFAPDTSTAFNPQIAHPDYPILIPALVALGWRLIGDTLLLPIVLHALLGTALVWAFHGARPWAFLMAALLAAQYAPNQCADVPLALCLLTATIAFFRRKHAITGLALGIGTLVKNEGLLLLLVFFAVWMVMERRLPFRAIASALPCLVLLGLFKAWVGHPNDVVGSSGILSRLVDASRYPTIIGTAVPMMLSFASGTLPVAALMLWRDGLHPYMSVPLVSVLVVLGGYLMIYAITPADIVVHMSSSFDRLLVHLAPAALYALTRPAPCGDSAAPAPVPPYSSARQP